MPAWITRSLPQPQSACAGACLSLYLRVQIITSPSICVCRCLPLLVSARSGECLTLYLRVQVIASPSIWVCRWLTMTCSCATFMSVSSCRLSRRLLSGKVSPICTGWKSVIAAQLLPRTREYELNPILIIIIMLSFWYVKLRQTRRLFCHARKASTIQHGYREWETRAQVFSQTFAHGNSKNETRQRHRWRR